MSDTRLILHIKGSENKTAELPKNIVRAGIAQGQITRSQLIWSKAHNAWKQVREMPDLLPSQKIAPAPAPRVGTTALPKVTVGARVPTGPVPKVVVKASATGAPPGGKPVSANPVVKAPSMDHLVVKHEEGGFHLMKWLCIILTVLILGAVSVNYLLVDQPVVSGMSQTAYAKVPVYAHLGAFVQPGALVIHIPISPDVNTGNLVDFLQALARSTPATTLGKNLDVVSLTTGWTGTYSIDGGAWKSFGDMTDEDDAHKQAFLLENFKDTSGESLVSPNGALDADAQQAERDKVWAQFVVYFTR